MITRIDIRDALSALIANAADKTPDVGEATERAWSKYFGNYPQWTGDDLLAAVWEYCKRPRERLVQPADLGEIIRVWRRDAIDRMDPDERGDAWADLGGRSRTITMNADGSLIDTDGVSYDRYGHVDKTSPYESDYPADMPRDQRIAAYWRRVRSGTAYLLGPDPEVLGRDEHPPGPDCADRDCTQPSTFGDYCARHYVLYAAWSRKGPTRQPAPSLGNLFDRDEVAL